jgi:sugar lactone lactonase YvrE
VFEMEAELVLDAQAETGEGPCWDEEKRLLYFVDITKGRLHTYDPQTGAHKSVGFGEPIGVAVPHAGGGLAAALQHGFYRVDPDTGSKTAIALLDDRSPDMRFNDGKCDARGRLFAGTMEMKGKPGAGALYRLDRDGSVHVILTDLSISNGLAWSEDGGTVYFIDSPTLTVRAYAFDQETGTFGESRVVARIPEGEGVPDGMCIDREGMLWVAQWGGYRVSRFDPSTGVRLGWVRVPAACASSCAFGGPNLDELYITTANRDLDDEERRAQPHAGGLFVARPGVAGYRAERYRGA